MARYRFTLRPWWILSHVFVVVVVVTFVNLGFWQLRRLDEKRDRNRVVTSRTAEPVAPVDEVLSTDDSFADAEAVAFRRVTATGTYDADRQVLVRGRSRDGAPGSWVLTPLVREDGTAVVVNRGWIANSGQLERVPDDVEVPDGETGEIVARGPTVMNGYWNRPQETATRLRGGWHHTNDLGRRERDGSLTFVGPKTRLIKSAAENIYPAEVEGAIVTHPAVAQCAVIGIPDPQWTQSVKAIVVLAEGATATGDEIVEHVRAQIASYKKPRAVEFTDELPRVGFAVDYDALDARFGGGGYPGVKMKA